MPLVRRPRRVDLEKLGGHLEQLFLDPRFPLLEGLALQRVEPDLGRVAAGVLLDLPQPPDRQVQLVLAGELQQDEIRCKSAHIEPGQAVVAGDAVVDVHDQVALFQVAEIGALFAERPRLARRFASACARAEDVLVGKNAQARMQVDEAAADLAGHQMCVDVG